MRYLLIIALAITVISCDKSGSSITDSENIDKEGAVAFTFRSSNQKIVSDFPEPTNVRVVVRRFEKDGLKFNALADVEVPTDTTIIIEMPAMDNYQIDAFSYLDSTSSLKPIFKVDQVSGVSVKPNEVTQVSLTLEPFVPSFSIPDTVERGENFEITANFDGFFNLPSFRNLTQTQYLAYLQPDISYQNSFNRSSSDYYDSYHSGSADLDWNVSISEFGNRYAYFQVHSQLTADEFYTSNESSSFILSYPNPHMADTLKTFVKVPDGGIGVDIAY